MVLGKYGAILVGTWWYWISIRRYWLILGVTRSVEGGTGSVWGDTCWYLVVLDQHRAVVVDTWWWGSVEGGTRSV